VGELRLNQQQAMETKGFSLLETVDGIFPSTRGEPHATALRGPFNFAFWRLYAS